MPDEVNYKCSRKYLEGWRTCKRWTMDHGAWLQDIITQIFQDLETYEYVFLMLRLLNILQQLFCFSLLKVFSEYGSRCNIMIKNLACRSHWISQRVRIVATIPKLTKNERKRRRKKYVMSHMSHVTCCVSPVTCNMSYVTCHMSHITNTNSRSQRPPPC